LYVDDQKNELIRKKNIEIQPWLTVTSNNFFLVDVSLFLSATGEQANILRKVCFNYLHQRL